MTKEQILAAAKNSFDSLTALCSNFNDALFFKKPAAKWSGAENLRHLVLSTNVSTLAFSLPKIIVQLMAGTANRPSRSYEELVAKYKQKLAEGGRASAPFVPKPIPTGSSKTVLIKQWLKATEKHLAKITNNRTETDLDKYLVRHPLLGRITLRELCYFTIYHTQHHQQIIKAITPANS
jgi:hypothetical protein